MSLNAILFALVAGILSFIVVGGISEMIVTNTLLGLVAGKLMDNMKLN